MEATLNKIIAEDLDFILNSNVDWEKFRNKTVFITGAYGMLLSYVTHTLLRLNELDPKFNVTVIALIRDKEKAKKRFGYLIESKYLKLFEHDMLSPIKISGDIDYIIHGASYASPHYFDTNPVAVLLPNVIGTYHLLELAKSKKTKGFLFFSSGAVYGRAGEVVAEKDYGYLDPLDVMSCYGESKRIAENMCKCWCSQFEIPVKIVRPAHIYGPTMDIENDSRVFANFVKNIVKGQNIAMKSDGSACRSFCYIADATVAYFKVLLDGADGEAYNVGNDAAYVSIKELAEIFVSTLPEKQLQVIVEKSENNRNCKIKGDRMLMSSKKVESLGWKCEFTIQEGLKRTVESFLHN
jgi:nucleoside-diphosphate-sugar epimerase